MLNKIIEKLTQLLICAALLFATIFIIAASINLLNRIPGVGCG